MTAIAHDNVRNDSQRSAAGVGYRRAWPLSRQLGCTKRAATSPAQQKRAMRQHTTNSRTNCTQHTSTAANVTVTQHTAPPAHAERAALERRDRLHDNGGRLGHSRKGGHQHQQTARRRLHGWVTRFSGSGGQPRRCAAKRACGYDSPRTCVKATAPRHRPQEGRDSRREESRAKVNPKWALERRD